ncbi:MAG TPA: TIGR01777 family oxidoreductase [Bryobacteraceae bacterium]|nr:TIGR01777 family oxidoreductase [Bryobacteraceae bacterium]
MTFLITGATGFLGRRLVDMLIAEGHAVVYLAGKRSKSLDSRAAFHLWTHREQMLLELKAVPLCDAVIHLAGEPIAQRWTSEAKKRIRESRILRTRDLVDGIGQLPHKPGVFISASAVGYYGNRGNEVLTEESAPGKGFLADVCVHWEEEADRAREFGLRVVKVRNGMVLGEDGGALKKLLPPFRMGLGGRLGSGKQWVSWIHRDDLLRMLIWAAANPNIAGVLNGTAPEPVTNAQFTRDLAHALGKPAIIPVPRFGLRLALGEMSDVLLDSARAIPAAAQQQGFQFAFRDVQPALEAILRKSG